MKGTVKFYNDAKGFGFITGEDNKDVFVHQTGLKEGVMIADGDAVTFEIVDGERGPKAEQVELDNSEDSSSEE